MEERKEKKRKEKNRTEKKRKEKKRKEKKRKEKEKTHLYIFLILAQMFNSIQNNYNT